MKALITFVLCAFFAASGFAQSTTNHTPMTNSEFNQLLQSARSKGLQSFSSETTENTFKAMFASNSSYLSTAQARKLLSGIAKDSGKLALARMLYGRVTDPVNFEHLSDLFKLANYRDEFLLWVHQPDSLEDSVNRWESYQIA